MPPIPSRMDSLGGGKKYIQPLMTSCTTWSNEPSFGMQVWGLSPNKGIMNDTVTSTVWGRACPYYPFSERYDKRQGRLERWYLWCRWGRGDSGSSSHSLCMKFDQPLVLQAIRFHQAEIEVGWVKVALVRGVSTELRWWGGTVLDQITIPNYTTYEEAAADQHILRVPEAQQEYGDSYTIRVVSSEYGWSNGILVFDNYTKIDAVY